MIKAIETRYKGYRFRSRLEARWAIFLDVYGVRWEYEKEGFLCERRCNLSGDYVYDAGDLDSPFETFPYLPDFWLPDLKLHVEVKGQLDDAELHRLLDAAAYLSCPTGGCGYGSDVLVLGNIPNAAVGFDWCPHILHMHKGILIANPVSDFKNYSGGCGDYDDWIADDAGSVADDAKERLLRGGNKYSPAYLRALNSARSARFEHGETPFGRAA